MTEKYTSWVIFLVGVLGVIACGDLKDLSNPNDAGGDASNCECSSEDGPCCDGCNFYAATDDQVCEAHDYDCSDTICGADTQIRTGEGQCEGGTSDCTGDITWGDWVTDEICSSSQLCETDEETYATCTTCDHGCADGSCWPECNPLTDDCCQTGGFDCIAGCKLGGECYLPMTNCTGGKYDPNSNLCWQDPPNESGENWFYATGTYEEFLNPDSYNYCPTIGSSWRFPTLSELRSLVRGCKPILWELDWTEVPEGSCDTWDSCLWADECNNAYCDSIGCPTLAGPGSGGCYWDPALSGSCDNRYWSAGQPGGREEFAWPIDFNSGEINMLGVENQLYVRCVRDGP